MGKRLSWWAYVSEKGAGVDTPKKKTPKVQHERMLQQSCVTWFRLQFPKIVIMSSINGVKLYGTREERINKWKLLVKEGAVAGASDLFVFHAAGGYHGLCLEIKYKDGSQSSKQKEFQSNVEGANYKYVVASSFDEFQSEVNSYMHGRTDSTVGNGRIFDSKG